MSDKETTTISFGFFHILYFIILCAIHWNVPIGAIPMWEFFMLWIYVVIIPWVAIILIIMIIAMMS